MSQTLFCRFLSSYSFVITSESLVPLTEELEQVGKNINSIARLATVVGRISYENKMDMSILMQKIVDVMEEKDVYFQK